MPKPNAELSQDSAGRYWAFLSYSHHDEKWATWLHMSLETYKIPTSLVGQRIGGHVIPLRLMPIFRDRDEFPSAPSLTKKINETLREARTLIVICSPFAATSRWVNEEIRTYQALGRGDRILALIVDGEPNSSDRECFPPALRFAVGGDCAITNESVEPIAADAREGRDGRENALLKLVAGVLGVGFDDLKRRETRRRHRIAVMRAATSVIVCATAITAYILLADADLDVPGGASIRTVLDRYNLTVFRPVLSLPEIRRAAQESRRIARRLTVGYVGPMGSIGRNRPVSFWSLGQAVAALYRDPDAGADDMKNLPASVDRISGIDFDLVISAVEKGEGSIDLDRGENVSWMLLALAGNARRSKEVTQITRSQIVRYLDRVESVAEWFHPDSKGGWTMVSHQFNKSNYSTYSTVLALNALVEMSAGGLCWHNNCAHHHALLTATAEWLIKAFIDEKTTKGWGRTLSDDKGPNPIITLMVYGALGGAQSVGGVKLPEAIRQAAIRDLTSLSKRNYRPSNEEGTFHAIYVDQYGHAGPRVALISRLLWYPWAVHSLYYWLQDTERENQPREGRRALMRSLGHIVVGLANDVRDEIQDSNTVDFAVVETYYGLTFIP